MKSTRDHPLARCTESFEPIGSPGATRVTSERVNFKIKICRLLRAGTQIWKRARYEKKALVRVHLGCELGLGLGLELNEKKVSL